MHDPVGELAAILADGGGPAETLGVAAAAGVSGRVQVTVGPATWMCVDLPSRPARAGDTLLVTTSNSPTVVRNLTREKNPPTAPAKTSINTTASSGAYSWTDGTQLGTYANDIAAVTRALAGDINENRADLQDLRDEIETLKTALKASGTVK